MISVEAVSKTYGASRALDQVSLVAADGSVTGVVGPDGAGRSTLLRVVAGLVVPDSGRVRIDRHPLLAAPQPGRSLGVSLDPDRIPAGRTARGHLRLAASLQGLGRHHVEDVLRRARLDHLDGVRVRDYSPALRRRLAVAAALVGTPDNLVLDEPLAHADPDDVSWFRGVVREALDRGAAVLLSSHDADAVSVVADHVVVLDRGRVVRDSPTAAMVRVPRARRTYFESTDLDGAVTALRRHHLAVERYDEGALVSDCEPQFVGALLFAAGPGVTVLRDLADGTDGRTDR